MADDSEPVTPTPNMFNRANRHAFARIAQYFIRRHVGLDATEHYRRAVWAIEQTPTEAQAYWRRTLDECLNDRGRGSTQ